MDDIKLFKKCLLFGLPFTFFLILFLALLTNESSSGSDEVISAKNFTIPFNKTTIYKQTSGFGYRTDPLGRGTSFHDGIDLATSCGTDVLASGDGVIYEVGYSADGLGNYVYIKHDTDQGDMYTAYGHMLDNSIVVEKNQKVTTGTKIGQVGSTGASTGCHLHFMIMKGKRSFKKEYLVDPTFVINGLN